MLENMGNEKSNQIYESKLGTHPKPTPESSRQEKEQFIRDKYELLKFQEAGPSIAVDKPTAESLYKDGYLCDISVTALGNSTKRRWCVLKVTPNSAQLFYYRTKGVSIGTIVKSNINL